METAMKEIQTKAFELENIAVQKETSLVAAYAAQTTLTQNVNELNFKLVETMRLVQQAETREKQIQDENLKLKSAFD